jgi:hypothetical protein
MLDIRMYTAGMKRKTTKQMEKVIGWTKQQFLLTEGTAKWKKNPDDAKMQVHTAVFFIQASYTILMTITHKFSSDTCSITTTELM